MRLTFLLLPLVWTSANAASLVLDTFDESPQRRVFEPGDESGTGSRVTVAFDSPFGSFRSVRANDSNPRGGTTMIAEVDIANDGQYRFTGSGPLGINPNLNAGAELSYRSNDPNNPPPNLLGFNAFEIDVVSLTGTGRLLISVGGSGFPRPSTFVDTIEGVGTIRIPFSEITPEAFERSGFLGIGIVADTELFEIVIDEIRLVPEPSTSLFLACAGLAGLARRR